MTSDLVRLRAAGIDDPTRELRILQGQFEGEALDAAIARRAAREPMSHILGYRDFWRDRFWVNADVLDPRPDSELFLELATARGQQISQILDLGTGSGALGLSALREFTNAQAILADISEAALKIAKSNAENLGLDARAKLVQSDWFENMDGKFDLILCNPPYLTKKELENAQAELKFEPKNALTDAADGLTHYRKIAPVLGKYLAPNGIAYFEHGAKQQVEVAEIFKNAGFAVQLFRDLSNNPRIVAVFLP